MEAEDLINKAKDIQMLRVTKELQERLMMENIQSKDAHQIETLEKTIQLNQKVRIYMYNNSVIILYCFFRFIRKGYAVSRKFLSLSKVTLIKRNLLILSWTWSLKRKQLKL